MTVTDVPFYRQSFSKAEIAEVTDTIKSGWLTTGKKTHELEARLAAYIGAKQAVAVNSCTAAMHLLLVAAGIGPGDEIVTTPYTFASTSEVILYTGARPVYCDINYDTLNLDSETVAAKIGRKTKAIMPVHIAGLPLDMTSFVKLGRDSKVRLFDDAAHAIGAKSNGKMIGSIGDGSAFSFYAVKNLTTGEGGLVTTRHKRLADKIRLIRLHGMSKGAWNRYGKGGSWRYDLVDLGYKYNLTDLHASIGLRQLDKFASFQEKRRKAVERYLINLKDIAALKLPATDPDHAWHLFILRLRLNQLKITRDRFIEELNRRNIGTSVHFIPLFMQSFYRRHLNLRAADYPNATRAFKEVITLPLFPSITRAEIDYVCEAVADICKKHKR